MRFHAIGGLITFCAFVTVMAAQLTADPAAPASTQTSPAWGKADVAGVQMRLQAVKRIWQSFETPSLTLDMRNTSSKTALYFGLEQECLIEVDGHWYTWSEPVSINMPARQLDPGKEKDGAVTVQLTDVWFRSPKSDVPNWNGESMGDAKGITYLKLSPGKHAVRVKFRPGALDTTITAISNPAQIEVVAAGSATATPLGAH
jgi:hypothetical protein